MPVFLNMGSAEPQGSVKGGSPRLEVNKRKNRKTEIVVSKITPQKICHVKKKNTKFRV